MYTNIKILYFITFLGQSVAPYDVCFDDLTQTHLACQPSLFDIVWHQSYKVSIDPTTATCGSPASTFRRLGRPTDPVQTCDASSPANMHPPDFIVDNNTTSWWQSVSMPPNSKELRINITMSFNKTYSMAGDVIITFNSARPEKMILEKSVDYGQTWTPLQFYARSCADFQSQLVPGASITVDNPTAVVCVNRYVETTQRPAAGQSVKLDNNNRFNLFLGPLGLNLSNFYTALETKMLSFLQFTDLRIRLIQPATDGLRNYDMYYFGIQDFQAVAWCFCNLHAAYCNYTDTDVMCDCKHNTTGKNCEKCQPLYNERRWQKGSYIPHDTGTANECIKCECNDHALSCTYNETYGRGICNNCSDNTRGYHCELCIFTYYPNISSPLNHVNRCIECDCEILGVRENNLVCAQEESPGTILGQCICRPLITGRRCNECVPGYYGLLTGPSIGNCTACNCTLDGTEGQNNTCAQNGGQCPCKPSITGRACDTCADGYFSFPTGNPQRGCLSCGCDKGGSLQTMCDKVNGTCTCKTNITGAKCNQVAAGSYVPAIDILKYEPMTGGPCQVTSDLYTDQAPFDGSGFAVCALSTVAISQQFEAVKGGMVQPALQWPYKVAVRYTGNNSDTAGSVVMRVTGSTPANELSALATKLGKPISSGCPFPVGSSEQISLQFPTGTSTAALSHAGNVTIDARCQYNLTLTVQQIIVPNTTTTPSPIATISPGGGNATNSTANLSPGGGDINNVTAPLLPANVARKKRAIVSASSLVVDSVVLLPALYSASDSVAFQVFATSENQNETEATYMSCLQQVAALTTRSRALQVSPCKDLLFSVTADLYDGGKTCVCNTVGTSSSSSCQSLGGQCPCKPGVGGLTCDACLPGYYNYTEVGCIPCNCDHNGAQHGACSVMTGQCPCKPNIVLQTDDPSSVKIVKPDNSTTAVVDGFGHSIVIDGTCRFCRPNFYGIGNGTGCSPCSCNSDGSISLQCDETGQCPCKDSVTGLKCDTCKDEFYGFGPNGCNACNCSSSGSISSKCSQTSGVCECKANVRADKCTECKPGYFNLASYNPNGCQPCFCYGHSQNCSSAPGFKLAMLQMTNPGTPAQYIPLLGDQHTSYGRTLTLGITSILEVDLYNVTLVTIVGNGKTLYYRGKNGTTLTPGKTFQYQVVLFEQDWVINNGNAVMGIPAALELTRVLADLTSIAIIESHNGASITVAFLGLESATNGTEGGALLGGNVTFVEQCTCQDNTGGLSCKKCATGHMRENTNFTSYDSCIPCNCSKKGFTDPPACNETTGVCLNCRNGTAGDHCERCAPFVIGPECDNCLDVYWGLQADGCRACNCSSPGSTSELCEKISGNCSCASHVVGRTCDKCEENYQNLSATGCVECDVCYSLLKTEILPVRQKRDKILANTTAMENQDVNSKMGPFLARLTFATSETNKLVAFLTSAEKLQSETTAQIQSLNSTLVAIENRMNIIEMNTTSDIEKILAEVEPLVNSAKSLRANMENQVKTIYTKLGTLQDNRMVLSNLTTNLRTVEQYLQSLADASTSDQAILTELNILNQTVAQANNLANVAMQKAQDALKIDQDTTSTLLVLEGNLLALVNRVTTTLTSARSLAKTEGTAMDTINKMQNQLVELSSLVIDFASIGSRISSAQSQTSSLQSQVTGESALFGPSNLKALESVSIVANLTNGTQSLGSNAAEWLKKSNTAKQRSLAIQNEANLLYQKAQNTLAVVANFSSKVADVKQKANQSLQQVASLAELSKNLIGQSENLTSSLIALRQNASAARESSQQALQIIQGKYQQLLALSTTANQLQARVSTLQDESSKRYQELNNIKVNVIEPGRALCQNLNTSVTTFRQQLATAEDVTSNASQQIVNVTRRANELLALLKSLNTIDSNAIQELLNQVLTVQSTFDLESLRMSVVDLQNTKNTQRAQIDNLKNLKETLKLRSENLKNLLSQLKIG